MRLFCKVRGTEPNPFAVDSLWEHKYYLLQAQDWVGRDLTRIMYPNDAGRRCENYSVNGYTIEYRFRFCQAPPLILVSTTPLKQFFCTLSIMWIWRYSLYVFSVIGIVYTVRVFCRLHIMTSSHGTIFHITGSLWGEFTGDRWIFLT